LLSLSQGKKLAGQLSSTLSDTKLPLKKEVLALFLFHTSNLHIKQYMMSPTAWQKMFWTLENYHKALPSRCSAHHLIAFDYRVTTLLGQEAQLFAGIWPTVLPIADDLCKCCGAFI